MVSGTSCSKSLKTPFRRTFSTFYVRANKIFSTLTPVDVTARRPGWLFLLLLQHGLHHQEPEKVIFQTTDILGWECTCNKGVGAGGVNPEIAVMSRLVITESKAACEKRMQRMTHIQTVIDWLVRWLIDWFKLTCKPCHNSVARPWGGVAWVIAIEAEWQVIWMIAQHW